MQRYEQLRGAVIASPRPPGAGLGEAVVVRRGLAAWLECTAAEGSVAPEGRRASEGREALQLPAAVHAELLSVLVNLVIGGHVPQELSR